MLLAAQKQPCLTLTPVTLDTKARWCYGYSGLLWHSEILNLRELYIRRTIVAIEVTAFKKMQGQMGVALLSQKPMNSVAAGLSKALQS